MRGASRVAFAEARDRLTEVVADVGVAATVGDEMFEVVRLLELHGVPLSESLERCLASGRPEAAER